IGIVAPEVFAAHGDKRVPPDDWFDLIRTIRDEPELYDAISAKTKEMFEHNGFTSRESLTMKESAIAVRSDLTHEEKMAALKPIRADRVARERAMQERNQAAVERALAEIEAAKTLGQKIREHCEAEEKWREHEAGGQLVELLDDLPGTPDVVPMIFEERLTDAGRIHAVGLGIRLD
ncbi:MAG TPA: hypothetical protein VF214_01915, partial [Edaphobacter sp.]